MNTRTAMPTLTVVLTACVLSLTLPVHVLAQEKAKAAALYRSKCANCHGAAGAGRRAIKGSNLLAREIRNMSDEELRIGIALGGKTRDAAHAFANKGMTNDQIQALIEYIRELQGKK